MSVGPKASEVDRCRWNSYASSALRSTGLGALQWQRQLPLLGLRASEASASDKGCQVLTCISALSIKLIPSHRVRVQDCRFSASALLLLASLPMASGALCRSTFRLREPAERESEAELHFVRHLPRVGIHQRTLAQLSVAEGRGPNTGHFRPRGPRPSRASTHQSWKSCGARACRTKRLLSSHSIGSACRTRDAAKLLRTSALSIAEQSFHRVVRQWCRWCDHKEYCCSGGRTP